MTVVVKWWCWVGEIAPYSLRRVQTTPISYTRLLRETHESRRELYLLRCLNARGCVVAGARIARGSPAMLSLDRLSGSCLCGSDYDHRETEFTRRGCLLAHCVKPVLSGEEDRAATRKSLAFARVLSLRAIITLPPLLPLLHLLFLSFFSLRSLSLFSSAADFYTSTRTS